MLKDDCYQLGSIVKKHGYKGEVKVRLDVDFPSSYSDLDHFLVEQKEGLLPYFLEYFELQSDGFAIAKIEGIDHEDDLGPILRKDIFLPLSELPSLSGDQFYFHEVIGFTVEDSDYGLVGILKDVIESGAQELLRIDKDGIEILIPLNDETYSGIDRKKKKLKVDAPEGLIDLYLGENG
jgi:16S rRNA processing protein RimM